ncbi:transcriptional regulator, GntR family [Actinomadura mexicana]|uniref:Transcriptional regulator, GntR family n=1 Tax=Actinomadura mexicana TaxID=134959 RepID=A0A238WMW1_9ACTN|nr:transcriptional regulator, GntR family [Actinomadura mexicana]
MVSQGSGRTADGQSPADRLRALILAGEMAPGQRLVEGDLAELLQVKRSAVRTALVELTAEKLVERIRNRGARVRVITVAEAIAMYECRMVLEGLCARKAAENVTEDEAEQLRTIGASMEAAVRDGDPLRYSQLNERLHTRIREIAAQPVAMEMLDGMHAQLVRHRFRLALRPGRPGQSLPQHLRIITTVAGGDAEGAEAAMREHVMDVIRALGEGDELALGPLPAE